jgi:hypothetical protein
MVRRGCRCISQRFVADHTWKWCIDFILSIWLWCSWSFITVLVFHSILFFLQLIYEIADGDPLVTYDTLGCRCALLRFAVEAHVFMTPSMPKLIVKILFMESCIITHPFGLEVSKFLNFFLGSILFLSNCSENHQF